MSLRRHIPNAITCLNLLSGCIGVIFALKGFYYGVACCVALSALFDFFDGFSARLLGAYSPMGKELDSLADLVSFGLAPALLVMHGLSLSLPANVAWLSYAALLIPVFSALRLAKFNIDTRQSHSFIGLPVPADALWWIGVCHVFASGATVPLWLVLCVLLSIILFSYLMVSEIPMFSLKFSSYGWRGNALRYVLLGISVVLLAWQGLTGLAPAIGVYILLSLWQWRRAA